MKHLKVKFCGTEWLSEAGCFVLKEDEKVLILGGWSGRNRAFRAEEANMVDLAPTILDALGVPAGPAMEGSTLLI